MNCAEIEKQVGCRRDAAGVVVGPVFVHTEYRRNAAGEIEVYKVRYTDAASVPIVLGVNETVTPGGCTGCSNQVTEVLVHYPVDVTGLPTVWDTTNLLPEGDLQTATPTNPMMPGWTSTTPIQPAINAYPPDTSISLMDGPFAPTYFSLSGQMVFPGDVANNVPATSRWLYSNGNTTGSPVNILNVTFPTVVGRKYKLFCYVSNVINGVDAPADPLLEMRLNGTPIVPYVSIPEDNPDTWSRMEAVFVATTAASTVSWWDAQLSQAGDDLAITGFGLIQEVPPEPCRTVRLVTTHDCQTGVATSQYLDLEGNVVVPTANELLYLKGGECCDCGADETATGTPQQIQAGGANIAAGTYAATHNPNGTGASFNLGSVADLQSYTIVALEGSSMPTNAVRVAFGGSTVYLLKGMSFTWSVAQHADANEAMAAGPVVTCLGNAAAAVAYTNEA
jgi:hypothetical protein